MKASTAFLVGSVIGILINTVVWTVILGINDFEKVKSEINLAVEQCEQPLARNQHCEPVISAKIVEEEE